MSDETTVERPERMTDEDRTALVALKHKEAAAERAEAAEAAEEKAAEEAEYAKKMADRQLFHVLVRHMGRSPRTRTMRAGRAGHRRQGVILDNGTRIKKKGRRRYTPVDLTTLAGGHNRLLEYVRTGTLEVCDPRTEAPIPYEALCQLIASAGGHLAEQRGEDFKLDDSSSVVQDEVPGSESSLNTAPTTRDDLGESAALAAVDQHEAEAAGEANPPEDEEVTEEQMLGMKLDDLKALAIESGVAEDAVEKLRSKKEVVALITREEG